MAPNFVSKLWPSAILQALESPGPDTIGFIPAGQNEGLLFFDNIFPLKTSPWDFRNFLIRLSNLSPESHLPDYLPRNLPGKFTVESIHARHKDGGAFLKFSYDPSETDLRTIESLISEHLHHARIRQWFSPLRPLRVYLVEGIPWTEDLYRFPSARLKVEFTSGPDLSPESLYHLFRRFGKIAEISRQPSDSKELPRYAVVQFSSVRSATAARNCLHRARYLEPTVVAEQGTQAAKATVLRISYEKKIKVRWLGDWFFKHPRIVIPVLAAVIATITVAVFDPIRTWFIKAKVTGALTFNEYESLKRFWRHTIAYFPFRMAKPDDPTYTLLDERKSIIDTLKSWLIDTSETFIVVQGPRGSGKRELVLEHVLSDRKNVLIIDCEPITEAHGDSAIISAAAQQVGYRPLFSWMNTITSLADLAAQGMIGTSVGFSQTLEIQFNKILQNTGTALKQIALEGRSSQDQDFHINDEEYLSAHPENRPVVVIDNFLHSPEGTMIYDRLAAWAALWVSANVAHVIFLTNDVSFSKSLSKSLPDRVFRSVLLGDASTQSAKMFVLSQLADGMGTTLQHPQQEAAVVLEKELDDCINVLGGRLTDLEALATRIRSGERPAQAVSQIVAGSAAEILKLYLSPGYLNFVPKSPRKWTTEQAWHIITRLTAQNGNNNGDGLKYNEVVLHDIFKAGGGEESIQGLEHSELISIVAHPNGSGRPYAIRPGRPVYNAAFAKLMEDEVLRAKMDMGVLTQLMKIETDVVKKCEEELAVLATLGGGKEVGRRMEYLGRRIGKAQLKIEGYEASIESLKEILKGKY
ncbi:RNA12 protein-domain-containing protein [Kalaharituber pfeilii]|nr:RNA12 protein-domain-containing protein [Kalaharituber pfeilii]